MRLLENFDTDKSDVVKSKETRKKLTMTQKDFQNPLYKKFCFELLL